MLPLPYALQWHSARRHRAPWIDGSLLGCLDVSRTRDVEDTTTSLHRAVFGYCQWARHESVPAPDAPGLDPCDSDGLGGRPETGPGTTCNALRLGRQPAPRGASVSPKDKSKNASCYGVGREKAALGLLSSLGCCLVPFFFSLFLIFFWLFASLAVGPSFSVVLFPFRRSLSWSGFPFCCAVHSLFWGCKGKHHKAEGEENIAEKKKQKKGETTGQTPFACFGPLRRTGCGISSSSAFFVLPRLYSPIYSPAS